MQSQSNIHCGRLCSVAGHFRSFPTYQKRDDRLPGLLRLPDVEHPELPVVGGRGQAVVAGELDGLDDVVVLEGDQLRAGGGVPQLGAEVGGAGGGAGGVSMNKYEGFTLVLHYFTVPTKK